MEGGGGLTVFKIAMIIFANLIRAIISVLFQVEIIIVQLSINEYLLWKRN